MIDEARRQDGEERELSPATLAVRAGEDAARAHRGTQVPIVHSVAFGYEDVDTWVDVALGRREGHIYSRNTNPTVAAFEEKVRLLEGAEAATSFATGMAAVSNTLFALVAPGERVVSVKDTYGGTNQMFVDFLPRIGVEVELCDTSDLDADRGGRRQGLPPALPRDAHQPDAQGDGHRPARGSRARGGRHRRRRQHLRDADQPEPAGAGRGPRAAQRDQVPRRPRRRARRRALRPPDLIKKVYHYREITGAALDPMAAYLLVRSLKTLALRVRQQNENAMTIARWLAARPEVEAVNYPGLESHLHHDVAARQMRGYGGMLSFSLRGGFDAVKRVLPRLRLAHLRRQPRRRGDAGRRAGDHEPRRVHGRGARRDGHSRGARPLLGGHRGRRRPDRRPRAGVHGRVGFPPAAGNV